MVLKGEYQGIDVWSVLVLGRTTNYKQGFNQYLIIVKIA